jgi:hypothetical protein
MCEKEKINAVNRQAAKPKRKACIKPYLKTDRPRNQTHPRTPSDYFIHLCEALGNHRRRQRKKGVAEDMLGFKEPKQVYEARETITIAFCEAHGVYGSVYWFSLEDLGGKQARKKHPPRWAKQEKPQHPQRLSPWPPLFTDKIEKVVFDPSYCLWRDGLPDAFITHLSPSILGKRLWDCNHVWAAFTRVKRQLAKLGLTFAEAGVAMDWKSPPQGGVLLVVRTDNERFPHIKNIKHLTSYLGQQRLQAQKLFTQLRHERGYRMSMSPEKYAQRVQRAKVKNAHHIRSTAERNRRQEASEQTEAHQIAVRVQKQTGRANETGLSHDDLLRELALNQARYRMAFERLKPGVDVMREVNALAEQYVEGIMLREEQAEAELQALLADFDDMA